MPSKLLMIPLQNLRRTRRACEQETAVTATAALWPWPSQTPATLQFSELHKDHMCYDPLSWLAVPAAVPRL